MKTENEEARDVTNRTTREQTCRLGADPELAGSFSGRTRRTLALPAGRGLRSASWFVAASEQLMAAVPVGLLWTHCCGRGDGARIARGCSPSSGLSLPLRSSLASQAVAVDRAPRSLRQLGDCLEDATHGPWATTRRRVSELEASAPVGDGRDSPYLETLMLRVEEMEVRFGAAPPRLCSPGVHPSPTAASAGPRESHLPSLKVRGL